MPVVAWFPRRRRFPRIRSLIALAVIVGCWAAAIYVTVEFAMAARGFHVH